MSYKNYLEFFIGKWVSYYPYNVVHYYNYFIQLDDIIDLIDKNIDKLPELKSWCEQDARDFMQERIDHFEITEYYDLSKILHKELKKDFPVIATLCEVAVGWGRSEDYSQHLLSYIYGLINAVRGYNSFMFCKTDQMNEEMVDPILDFLDEYVHIGVVIISDGVFLQYFEDKDDVDRCVFKVLIPPVF